MSVGVNNNTVVPRFEAKPGIQAIVMKQRTVKASERTWVEFIDSFKTKTVVEARPLILDKVKAFRQTSQGIEMGGRTMGLSPESVVSMTLAQQNMEKIKNAIAKPEIGDIKDLAFEFIFSCSKIKVTNNKTQKTKIIDVKNGPLESNFDQVKKAYTDVIKENLVTWIKANKKHIESAKVKKEGKGKEFGANEFKDFQGKSVEEIVKDLEKWEIIDSKTKIASNQDLRELLELHNLYTVDPTEDQKTQKIIHSLYAGEHYQVHFKTVYDSKYKAYSDAYDLDLAAHRAGPNKDDPFRPKISGDYYIEVQKCKTREELKTLFKMLDMAEALPSDPTEITFKSPLLQTAYKNFTQKSSPHITSREEGVMKRLKHLRESWVPYILFWKNISVKRAFNYSSTDRMPRRYDLEVTAKAATAESVLEYQADVTDLSADNLRKETFYKYYEKMRKIVDRYQPAADKNATEALKKDLTAILTYTYDQQKKRWKKLKVNKSLDKNELQVILNALAYAVPLHLDEDGKGDWAKGVYEDFVRAQNPGNRPDGIAVQETVIAKAKGMQNYLFEVTSPSDFFALRKRPSKPWW